MNDAQKHVIDVDGTKYLVMTHWYNEEEDTGTREGYAVQDVYRVSGLDNMGLTINKHVCSYQHADLYDTIEEQINNEL